MNIYTSCIHGRYPEKWIFTGWWNSLRGINDNWIPFGGSVFWQIGGIRRERFSLNLLFFKCLLLKIINIPKWHILGWHVLNSYGFFFLEKNPNISQYQGIFFSCRVLIAPLLPFHLKTLTRNLGLNLMSLCRIQPQWWPQLVQRREDNTLEVRGTLSTSTK